GAGTRGGRALRGGGRGGGAGPLRREARDIPRQGPPAAWSVADAQLLLGDCLAAQGRYAEAEPLLLAAHAGYRDARGAPPGRLLGAIDLLVKLYDDWGQPDLPADCRPPEP